MSKKQTQDNEVVLRAIEREGSDNLQRDYAVAIGMLLNEKSFYERIDDSVIGFMVGGNGGALGITFTLDKPPKFIAAVAKALGVAEKKGISAVVFQPHNDKGFRMAKAAAKRAGFKSERSREYVVVDISGVM
jgi:hypothetical protein